jgi:surface antigen
MQPLPMRLHSGPERWKVSTWSSTPQGCIMFRSRSLPALLCLCLSLFPATMQAQVNPFRNSRIGLNDADLQAMNAAAARLYQQSTVSIGATDSWSNPNSGNGGLITVLQSFTKSGMPCRKVRYDIHLRTRRGTRSYTLNWCKTAGGAWKIS